MKWKNLNQYCKECDGWVVAVAYVMGVPRYILTKGETVKYFDDQREILKWIENHA